METQDNIQGQPSAGARLQLVRNIVRALNSANNTITLYPPDSPMPREAAAGFITALDRLLAFEPYLHLSVSGNGLSLEGDDVCGTSSSLRRLAYLLHSRQVGQIRFLPGMDPDECVAFLRTLGQEPEVLRNKGGFAGALVAAGVSKVQVVDLAQEAAADSARAGVVDAGATIVEGVKGLSEEALTAQDPSHAREWLREATDEIYSRGLAPEESAGQIVRLVVGEAGQALTLGGAEAELGLENLAEAIASLDENSRRGLLLQLLGSAESSQVAGALLARIDDGELAASLAKAAEKSGADPASLLHASVGQQRCDRILEQVGAMVGAKAPQTGTAPIPAPPRRVEIDPSLPRFSRRSDEVAVPVSQLVAEARQFSQEERDGLLQVPHEARDDGMDKSIRTLLYLLSRPVEATRVADTASAVVEEALYASGAGRIDVLAEATGGIRAAVERAHASSADTRALDEAMAALSSADVATKVVEQLDGPDGAARVADAADYLAAANSSAQDTALQTVGTEISGELKERIHAVFAKLGQRALGVVERHTADRNWVVAHSSVVILQAMKEPRAIPALRRALGHGEPHVVEQAIKGLAAIGGPEAGDGLAWAVEHTSGQTQMLAIDAAGGLRSERAVPALDRIVAAGGDLFGRSVDQRVAAVKALVSIGNTAAAAALETAQRTRFMLSPGKTRQYRRAVAEALKRLQSAFNGTQDSGMGNEGGSGK